MPLFGNSQQGDSSHQPQSPPPDFHKFQVEILQFVLACFQCGANPWTTISGSSEHAAMSLGYEEGADIPFVIKAILMKEHRVISDILSPAMSGTMFLSPDQQLVRFLEFGQKNPMLLSQLVWILEDRAPKLSIVKELSQYGIAIVDPLLDLLEKPSTTGLVSIPASVVLTNAGPDAIPKLRNRLPEVKLSDKVEAFSLSNAILRALIALKDDLTITAYKTYLQSGNATQVSTALANLGLVGRAAIPLAVQWVMQKQFPVVTLAPLILNVGEVSLLPLREALTSPDHDTAMAAAELCDGLFSTMWGADGGRYKAITSMALLFGETEMWPKLWPDNIFVFKLLAMVLAVLKTEHGRSAALAALSTIKELNDIASLLKEYKVEDRVAEQREGQAADHEIAPSAAAPASLADATTTLDQQKDQKEEPVEDQPEDHKIALDVAAPESLAEAAPREEEKGFDPLPPPFEWVDIPAGKVILAAERGEYKVSPFTIAKYPITNAQYRVFVDAADGYRDPRWWEYSPSARSWRSSHSEPTATQFTNATLPRTNVCWYDAVAFCRWLSHKTSYTITLPTEIQWQRAAQGDDGRPYPWGSEFDKERCNSNQNEHFNGPSPVTQFPAGASPYGVTDMCGNVWEWCLDKYEGSQETDLQGSVDRVTKGGSWHSLDNVSMGMLRIGVRAGRKPDLYPDIVGFRCVRVGPTPARLTTQPASQPLTRPAAQVPARPPAYPSTRPAAGSSVSTAIPEERSRRWWWIGLVVAVAMVIGYVTMSSGGSEGDKPKSSTTTPVSVAMSAPVTAPHLILEGHTGFVSSVAFSPDGRYVLSASGDKTLRLWEVDTGETVRVMSGHTGFVSSAAFSPDGRYALSGSEDKTLRLWEVETGETVRVMEGQSIVRGVAFSPDGRLALSGLGDNTLQLWEVETGETVRVMRGHTDAVRSVAFSPDGRLALSGSWDKTLRLWDVDTGQTVRVMEGHADVVSSVAFSPDGRLALSGSWDKTLRLWDVDTGQTVRVMRGHRGSVLSIALSPDGRYALSGSEKTALWLWDVNTGERVLLIGDSFDAVRGVAFSPDGRYVLSGSDDNTLRLWDVSERVESDLKSGDTTDTEPAVENGSQKVVTNAEWTQVEQEFDGITMVLVPAGCFQMGSEEGQDNEKPAHEVCFTEPFWIGKTEVTNEQFAQSNGQADRASTWMGADQPRERITWTEANAFCESRGERLPTEAEWEYAARGPDGLVYPWGNTFVADNVVYDGNSEDRTAGVGSRPGGASWVGALDMSGNVWEWVADRCGTYPSGRQVNPQGPESGNSWVLRGGSWSNDTDYLRSTYRGGSVPDYRYDYLGFRCARSR